MTDFDTGWPQPETAGYAGLAARFRPIFARLASGAAARDRDRVLPLAEVAELRAAGYTALALPTAEGGSGASVTELLALQTELAAADSNVTQALRAHFGQSLALLALPPGSRWRQRWGQVIAGGGLFASGFSETGTAGVGTFATTIRPDGAGHRVNGRKFYTTGGLYADWIATSVTDADGTVLRVNIPLGAAGVTVLDDWDGFGQQLTASGSVIFDNVAVPATDLPGVEETRWPVILAYAQISHLATLAGIGRAAVGAAVSYTRQRTRVFSHGAGPSAASDPLVQQRIGNAASRVWSANALASRAAGSLERLVGQLADGGQVAAADLVQLDTEVYHAQIVAQQLVLSAVSDLFDAMGASALSRGLGMDRFWRNARAIASHNPVIYKERIVGDQLINGTAPPAVWTVGAAPAG